MEQFNLDEMLKKIKELDYKEPKLLMMLVGSLVSIIACFLPFMTISIFGSYSFMQGAAGQCVLTIIANLAAIVLALILPKFAFIGNVIALLFTFLNIFEIAKMSLSLVGIGAWIMVIANIVAIVGSVLKFKEAE